MKNRKQFKAVAFVAIFSIIVGITACGNDTAPGGDGQNNSVNSGGVMNWTAVADSTFGNTRIGSVAYGNGTWVAGSALGYGAKIATSNNGINWTAVANLPFSYITSNIAYGNGMWVVGCYVGNEVTIATSTNGTNWTVAANFTSIYGASHSINSIAYGNGMWIACNQSKMEYFTSTNGLTWTKTTNSIFNRYSNSSITKIVYGNGKWVAVGGGSGEIATSTDGFNWTHVAGAFDSGYDVAYGNGRWVAVGVFGDYITSTDGTNWTKFSPSAHIYNRFLVYGNIWFSTDRSGSGYYATSTDGLNWKQPDQKNQYLAMLGMLVGDVAYGNGTWVAVGVNYPGYTGGKMAYSK
jgi:hypothetical protein